MPVVVVGAPPGLMSAVNELEEQLGRVMGCIESIQQHRNLCPHSKCDVEGVLVVALLQEKQKYDKMAAYVHELIMGTGGG